MREDSQRKKMVGWAGFALGPLMAALCLWSLPPVYQTVSMTPDIETSSIEASGDVVGSPAVGTVDAAEDSAEIGSTSRVFSWAGRATLAVMVWMGVWWLTEAVHISLTALLPIVLFPWLGVAEIGAATAPYANHLIFLYFGGFVLALSMERWGLGKRIALFTLKTVGTTAPRMIAGFMLVTAILSAFVSNTATTAMMLPIALSVIGLLRNKDASERPDDQGDAATKSSGDDQPDGDVADCFGTCLLLAIAYSASVGGIMTIIGTPPNAFLVGFLRDSIAQEYRYDFSFATWLPIGGSLCLVLLPIIYFVLTRVLFPISGIQLPGGRQMIDAELASLGKVNRGEWTTFIVFAFTVTAWLVRPLLVGLEMTFGGTPVHPFSGLTDTGIAMTAAMILYVTPVDVGRRIFAMDWETTTKMPWGILLLFGGGLSLAAAIKANGVAEFLGSHAGHFGQLPTVAMILLVTTAIVFLTELTSNVATTTSLVPVLAAIAPGIGVHPLLLVIPATLSASCAFMLPVATPPNAIVFGSGEIALPQMLRAGFLLNLIAIVVVTLVTMLVVRPWLGV